MLLSASLAASGSRVGGQQSRALSGIDPTSTNTQILRRVATRPSYPRSGLEVVFGEPADEIHLALVIRDGILCSI